MVFYNLDKKNKRNTANPRVSKASPMRTAVFFCFFSSSFKGLILPSFLYFSSIPAPIDNPTETPIAGPTPINPGFFVAMLREIPTPVKIAVPMPIHMPKNSLLDISCFCLP